MDVDAVGDGAWIEMDMGGGYWGYEQGYEHVRTLLLTTEAYESLRDLTPSSRGNYETMRRWKTKGSSSFQ